MALGDHCNPQTSIHILFRASRFQKPFKIIEISEIPEIHIQRPFKLIEIFEIFEIWWYRAITVIRRQAPTSGHLGCRAMSAVLKHFKESLKPYWFSPSVISINVCINFIFFNDFQQIVDNLLFFPSEFQQSVNWTIEILNFLKLKFRNLSKSDVWCMMYWWASKKYNSRSLRYDENRASTHSVRGAAL